MALKRGGDGPRERPAADVETCAPADYHSDSFKSDRPGSFKRMLGARRRGIECRSTCDSEGSHIRRGSGRVDRMEEHDVIPLKLGVEDNYARYPMELLT